MLLIMLNTKAMLLCSGSLWLCILEFGVRVSWQCWCMEADQREMKTRSSFNPKPIEDIWQSLIQMHTMGEMKIGKGQNYYRRKCFENENIKKCVKQTEERSTIVYGTINHPTAVRPQNFHICWSNHQLQQKNTKQLQILNSYVIASKGYSGQ